MLKVACPLTVPLPLYSKPYSYHLRINLHKKTIYSGMGKWRIAAIYCFYMQTTGTEDTLTVCGSWVVHYTNIMLDTPLTGGHFMHIVFWKLDLFPSSHVKDEAKGQECRILHLLHLTSEVDSLSKKLHISNMPYTKDNVQHNSDTLEMKSKYINAIHDRNAAVTSYVVAEDIWQWTNMHKSQCWKPSLKEQEKVKIKAVCFQCYI
jgi:hypothetical protein